VGGPPPDLIADPDAPENAKTPGARSRSIRSGRFGHRRARISGERMSHLSTTLRIEAPAAVVFDLIADPARNPEWQTLLAEMGDISGRPGGIGSSYVGFYKVAGRKLASRFVVTAAERPRILQVNGTTSGGWARWTTMIAGDGPACEIQVKLEYELPGEIVGSLFGMLTGNRIEREFRHTYENLKGLAETEAATAASALTPALGARVAPRSVQSQRSDDDNAAEPGGQLATS
jgi:ribosome-associated toxin RatA of RatAB toxin-antitoxin module